MEIKALIIMSKITVQETQETVLQWEEQDYISLTDMAAAKEEDSRAADIFTSSIVAYLVPYLE